MPTLKSVPTNLPEPPYPSDTKSGAFPFEIEVDRMLASDTWAVVNPEVLPWSLLTWVISWSLMPCGSLPSDDEVIAARLKCSRNFYDVHRKEILRGWVLHSDDRFYHPVITEKVLKFLGRRDGWKKAKMSQRCLAGHSEDSSESPSGVSGESPPSSSSSSSSSSSKQNKLPTKSALIRARARGDDPQTKKKGLKPKKSAAFVLPPEVDPEVWEEFEAHRVELHRIDKKKNPLLNDRARRIAANRLRRLPREEQRVCVETSVLSGWTGLFPKSKPGEENQPTRARMMQL